MAGGEGGDDGCGTTTTPPRPATRPFPLSRTAVRMAHRNLATALHRSDGSGGTAIPGGGGRRWGMGGPAEPTASPSRREGSSTRRSPHHLLHLVERRCAAPLSSCYHAASFSLGRPPRHFATGGLDRRGLSSSVPPLFALSTLPPPSFFFFLLSRRPQPEAKRRTGPSRIAFPAAVCHPPPLVRLVLFGPLLLTLAPFGENASHRKGHDHHGRRRKRKRRGGGEGGGSCSRRRNTPCSGLG